MTALTVEVLSARPAAQTAAPAITFRLRIQNGFGGRLHAIALRCQTRIEPRSRRYAPDEQARLYELFGEPSQWQRTLSGLTWAHSTLLVPSFEHRIEVELPIAITYDLEVASAKYLHALRSGEIPLLFLFSGTVFHSPNGGLQIEPVSWDLDAPFRMPAETWRAAMDQFFPGGGWLRLEQETIDRLQAFRGRHAVVSWDRAIDLLLQQAVPEQSV